MQAVALVREDWSTNETATNKKVAQLEGKEQQKVLAEKARKIFFSLAGATFHICSYPGCIYLHQRGKRCAHFIYAGATNFLVL